LISFSQDIHNKIQIILMAQITDFIKHINKQPNRLLNDMMVTPFNDSDDECYLGKQLQYIIIEILIKQKIIKQIGNLGDKKPTINNVLFDMVTIKGQEIPTYIFNVEYESNKPYMFMIGLSKIQDNIFIPGCKTIFYKVSYKKGISLSNKNFE